MDELKGEDNSTVDVEKGLMGDASISEVEDPTISAQNKEKEFTTENNDPASKVKLDPEKEAIDVAVSNDESQKKGEEKIGTDLNRDADNPPCDEPDQPPIDERDERESSSTCEKDDTAVEEIESGPLEDQLEFGSNVAVQSAELEAGESKPTVGSEENDVEQITTQESTMQHDDNSNSGSHLQDIEMTDVDEDCVKNEDTMEEDNDRSIDQSAVEDPFDQVKQATHVGDCSEENEIGKKVGEEHCQDNQDAERDKENNQAGGNNQKYIHQSEADQENLETSREAYEEDSTEHAARKETDGAEKQSNSNEEVTDTVDDDAEQQEQVATRESTVAIEHTMEEESSAAVDDLTGGENENVCLLPDDERAISEEDKERAIAEEEAVKEAERQEVEAREHGETFGGDDATGKGREDDGSAGEREGQTGKDGAGESDAQTGITELIEVQDDDTVVEEMEVDGTTSGLSADPPTRENQIRELSTPAASEKCAQCKKESIPCVYSMQREENASEGSMQFICSFDCVQSIRTELPGKFELIQRRVTIVPIFDCTEKCVRCNEQKICKFRYQLEEKDYNYICEMKCVENFTAINGEKYSLAKRRYVIEEKMLPLGDDKRCVHCGDTKPCEYGFMQDDEALHVCSDCINLFMTEHPDLFRLLRRRSVRVRNLPKASPTDSGSSVSHTPNNDIVKFTARTDEEAEAVRLDRATSFLRRCLVCQQSLLLNAEQWIQWETMDFCGTKCLSKQQNRIGSVCIHCRQPVSVPSLGKYCVRFGFSVCQFCSAGCLDDYKKKLIRCSYCQKDVSNNDKRYVARVGENGVFKDFCSQICHKRYQTSLNPTLKHKRHVCAVCNHEKLSKIIVHLEGREQYFCSTPCFSAFKFVNNVNPDECAMCRDYFERKSTEAYTIFPQEGSSDISPDGIPFCTQMCLNLYIISHRQIVSCHWCKVKKYNFDMIQRASGKIMLCSLHCLSLAEASVAAKTMQELRCDHCMFIRTPQYHLTMSDASLRNFCTYQCVMSFQSQFNKPSLAVQSSDQGEPATNTPVPTGLPKRIRKSGMAATTTGPPMAISTDTTAAISKATLPVANITTNTPPVTRARDRPTRSTTLTGNNSSTASNLPVISSVTSLATPRGSRAKGTPTAFIQGKWPELRVTLEPLINIPSSGTIPLSSILPHTNSNTARHEPSTVSLPSTPPPAPAPVLTVPPKIETRTQIVTIPPTPVQVSNASTMCKPIQVTRSVSCRPIQCNVECQTEEYLQRKIVIPIPVPIYVPVPMFMYSMPTPIPVPFPLPIPVPVFIPTTRNSAAGIMKEIKKIQDKMPSDPYEAELLMMAEMVAGDKKKDEFDSDSEDGADDDQYGADGGSTDNHGMEHNTSFSEDLVQMALKMASNDFEESPVDLESAMQANTISQQQQDHHGYADLQQHHHQQQLLMIEQQRQQDTPAVVQRGRKRGPSAAAGQRTAAMNNNTQQASATKRIKREQLSEPSPEPVRVVEPVEKPDANMCLKYTFGVNAWKQWVLTKNADLEKSSIRRKPFKSDILQLTADELNYSLCLFVKEVRKPNGTEYAPDTIYYLVLGIQQYLFENSRVENIFTDPYYEQFTDCLDEVAKKFSVLYNDSQFIVTRVEEEHLWECKQLGAHSPHVLLSTLMFFNTKHFNLVSVEEHMELSFSHIMKHWKRNPHQGSKSAASRNVLLRFYPPQSSLAANARKKKVYEQQENEEDPLRCPVKLYEFYLSKCPESVKTRNDVFYLQPERSCVPDSPVWYSTQPLSKESLSKMLHRVKMVKEINIALLTS